ncbi:MAG: HK97 family phage prohead protease [Planktomarina sp.]
MINLERKYSRIGAIELAEDRQGLQLGIEGYASLFGVPDQGGDVVQPGAYRASLDRLKAANGSVKMLWQHDPLQPIGVWENVHEDDRGLYVKGRLLPDVPRAAEAASLLKAGAMDGLSIGYRTVKATKNDQGQRLLHELDLWEVSLVTFPMLSEARIGAKSEMPDDTLSQVAHALTAARVSLARL